MGSDPRRATGPHISWLYGTDGFDGGCKYEAGCERFAQVLRSRAARFLVMAVTSRADAPRQSRTANDGLIGANIMSTEDNIQLLVQPSRELCDQELDAVSGGCFYLQGLVQQIQQQILQQPPQD
jgi:hypothetical protein